MSTNISTVTLSVQEAREGFKKLDEKLSHYGNILGLVNWDARTKAPKKGRGLFAKARGTLAEEVFALSTSEQMGQFLARLREKDAQTELAQEERAAVRERAKSYERSKKVPPELNKEYVLLSSNANQAWEQAREENNFEAYRPYLEKMVDLQRKFAELYGYGDHPYDALLADYEPGFTVEILDELFQSLRDKTVSLLQRIQAAPNQPDTSIFDKKYDAKAQENFSKYLLPHLGFDTDAGRLDETVHPFALAVNTGDIRLTTRYLEDNVRSSIFGTIHETGHGLYEQNVNPTYEGSCLRRGTSFGIHESQSRFLENVIGRSEPFWSYFFPALQATFPEQLRGVDRSEFARAVNAVSPSLIRVEADELTYNLHIMIRYEIEKGLIEGSIEVKDLPQVWNEKMQEYLGVVPETDTEGVLQDVHWSHGGFGYFPSYSLGNLYAAQIYYTVRKEIPNLDDLLRAGDVKTVVAWLTENIHQWGKLYEPTELVERVTGEPLNASYLVQYLEEKYTRIYDL
ncbi:carboxypeptidase M32 [Bacillus fonticola]|uniref:carboxypeptidase M32 n=1 Tax=Bacillus fonticola TaxID=2728853 RepID=UPI001472F7EA|nr:carboxypeptidase M32 [Bacillus fonticola]